MALVSRDTVTIATFTFSFFASLAGAERATSFDRTGRCFSKWYEIHLYESGILLPGMRSAEFYKISEKRDLLKTIQQTVSLFDGMEDGEAFDEKDVIKTNN